MKTIRAQDLVDILRSCQIHVAWGMNHDCYTRGAGGRPSGELKSDSLFGVIVECLALVCSARPGKAMKNSRKGAACGETIRRTVPRRGDTDQPDADAITGLDIPRVIGHRVYVQRVGPPSSRFREPDGPVPSHATVIRIGFGKFSQVDRAVPAEMCLPNALARDDQIGTSLGPRIR